MKTLRRQRPCSLQLEALEPRQVMTSGVTATLAGSVLNVVGTDNADQINFLQTSKDISIQGVTGSWAASKVKSIVVDLKGGDDFVSLNSFANGGNKALAESFTIISGAGSETVRLANGHDFFFSGVGYTLGVTTKGVASLNGMELNATARIVATLKKGLLTITGTSSNDSLSLAQVSGKLYLNGSGAWSLKKVSSIVFNLQEGTDTVSLNSWANGGNQSLSVPVAVNSGLGTKIIHLANGHDSQMSGWGHRLVQAVSGTVTIDGVVQTWNAPTPPAPNPPAPDPNPPAPTPPPANDWFTTNIQDAALRSLGSSLYQDNLIDRSDMIALLRSAEDSAVLDATELADLRAIVANTSLFGSLDYVTKLASYVVNGNAANAKFQGQALGNVAAGSSATQLENLVGKWFLGVDHPTLSTGTYRQVAGQLFVNGVSYTDIHQGSLGDCYFVASLGETALKMPNTITSMFVTNGDGTYTVRFYHAGAPEYVTVDTYLPTNANGQLFYATRGAMYNNSGNELWVALAEKAYVQLNEMGWERGSLSGNGQNAYSAIEGGYCNAALGHITGLATTNFAMFSAPASETTFKNAYNAGKLIDFASLPSPGSSSVVGSHAYAVLSYDATAHTVTLFNPWGTEFGLVTMAWSDLSASFYYFDRTA